MDKISIISNLQQIADTLDNKNLFAQAEKLTNLMVKIAQITTGEDERDFQDYENKQFTDRLREIPSSNTDIKPQIDENTNTVSVDGKLVKIPNNLQREKFFDKKLYKLRYDPEYKRFFYFNEKNKDIKILDANGKTTEPRSKRYDLWKQVGGRGLFGDLRLPNLNKSIPIEPFVRKELIPDIARVVRPGGDLVKKVITKPVSDTVGALTDDLGVKLPGRDTPSQADAKNQLGQSSDRSQVPVIVSDESKDVPGVTVDLQGGPQAVEPTAPTATSVSGGRGSGDGRGDIKISKNQLKDIKSPDDLLFWSMMVGNNIQYSKYDKSKEKQYYSKDNKPNTLNYINKLTSSSWVEKINPQIKNFKNEAINKLNKKTAGKNMNRQILASMNEICEELDELGMNKAASEITDMMVKLAQSKKVTVCLIDGKPAVKIEGRKKPIFGPASGPFTSASHARNYAARVSPNYIDEIPANVMPGRSWRNQGPTGKPWTKDDEEMFDFEASREDKF